MSFSLHLQAIDDWWILHLNATSPSSSLCVLANEPPLYIRRRKLSIQYCLKLPSSPQNPTHNTVFNCKFKDLFERKANLIPPLSIRVQPDSGLLI